MTTTKSWFDYLILALAFSLMVFLVNPIGDFPLNDDWAYGKTIRTLLETGELHFSNWMHMTLVAQIFWGPVLRFLWIFIYRFAISLDFHLPFCDFRL